jgi:hypothetical protein
LFIIFLLIYPVEAIPGVWFRRGLEEKEAAKRARSVAEDTVKLILSKLSNKLILMLFQLQQLREENARLTRKLEQQQGQINQMNAQLAQER